MRLLGMKHTSYLFFILPFAMLIAPNNAQAQAKEACDSTGQQDLIVCADAEYKRVDNKLNSAYRVLMSRLSDPQKASVRSTQKVWINFRDTECNRRGDIESFGREAPIERLSCLASTTADRTKEIETIGNSTGRPEYFRILNSLVRSGFSLEDLKSRLASASQDDPSWTRYLDENCKNMNEINLEPIPDCKARVNLFRSD